MLSYEGLIAHARERGMPPGKLRGAAREYLQVLALKALYAQPPAAGLLFLGGTALRLGENLPRFSEDLDFDAKDLALRAWKTLLEETAHALARVGLKTELRAAEKGRLLSADLRFTGFLQSYHLTDLRAEKLRIKLETNRPKHPLAGTPKVVSGFGEMFPVSFAAPELMAAEKLLALLSRELGRDVYDLFFMAGKKWRPDPKVLKAAGLSTDPAEAAVARVSSWGPRRLARMARGLEPFLFEPDQARLVASAHELLPGALGSWR